MRGCPRGQQRSVDRGARRPAIEPRKYPRPGRRRRSADGRQYGWARYREAQTARRGRRHWHAWTLLAWEPGDLTTDRSATAARSASGRRGAVADDARSREVRLCHSSWEADEQSGPDRSGAGGAKGGGQGECEPAKHAPDSEPGKRVPRAGAHTAKP